jgi:type I restriction enzyme R subunit
VNTGKGDPKLAAEQRARVLIDRQLADAGWWVQDKGSLNLFASDGVAVREVVMKAGHGRADYLLYVDKKVVGVIEAKPEGTTLSGVEWQSAMYAGGIPADAQLRSVTVDGRLPFVFEASGSETHFTNGYDPQPRARRVFSFPRPATLAKIVRDAESDPDNPTWRAKVRHLPPLDEAPLRPAQITAIKGIEQSLADQHFDRSLVQMATGAGKTFTAVTTAYRLLKHGGFRRILFLVDRNNLAEQTIAEFQNYRTPGDGRRFTEIYNVDKLTSAGMLGSSDVVVSTIQRVYSVLRGQRGHRPATIPTSTTTSPTHRSPSPTPATLPPEAFDLVIVDEAHRSIYGVWRWVLEYFDAHVIGLTATPGKQTFAFFRQNLVSEYTYPQSVADRVNVDFDLYRIRTQISEQGGNDRGRDHRSQGRPAHPTAATRGDR